MSILSQAGLGCAQKGREKERERSFCIEWEEEEERCKIECERKECFWCFAKKRNSRSSQAKGEGSTVVVGGGGRAGVNNRKYYNKKEGGSVVKELPISAPPQ